MRHFLSALAFVALAGGTAIAQYKAPQAPPSAPPVTGPTTAIPVSANPAVQITPVTPAEQLLESARRITREEAIKMIKAHKAVYVDVRGKDQYDAEHIPGALNIPGTELLAHLKTLPVTKYLITYCA
jgi:hypothetical protein